MRHTTPVIPRQTCWITPRPGQSAAAHQESHPTHHKQYIPSQCMYSYMQYNTQYSNEYHRGGARIMTQQRIQRGALPPIINGWGNYVLMDLDH